MADGNGNGNGVRVLIPWTLVVLAVAAMIALSVTVKGLSSEVEKKANRETVEAQNRAVLQGLEDIRADIRELRHSVTKQ